MVEPLLVSNPLTEASVSHRTSILEKAHYNVFSIPAREILIDLLTDSGTGAMSQEQWAAMMLGDESYAQATSYERFERQIREVIGADFLIIPTHQGRAAENILFHTLNKLAAEVSGGREPQRRRVIINSFFDTTAANVTLYGSIAPGDMPNGLPTDNKPVVDPVKKAAAAAIKHDLLITRNQFVVDQTHPVMFEHGIFGGNIDLDRLEDLLRDDEARREIMLVMLTVTNNTGGGLPVSLANMRAVREMIDHYARNDQPMMPGLPPIMFFLDACRFAENAYFIQQHEPGQGSRTVAAIAREMFSLVHGCTMSAKKDGMANIGGFLACRDDDFRRLCWEHMVEIEGFYTYGGLSGRDMEAVAVGMREGVDDSRVNQRVQQVRLLWQWLNDDGIPVKEPCGGHGIFLKGRAFWTMNGNPLIDDRDLPGHTLALELYRRYAIRGCEIGTIMFGDFNLQTGRPERVAADEDYVRLAIPRRTYTNDHLEYVAAALCELYRERERCPWRGMRFTYRPAALPHFLSHFRPIERTRPTCEKSGNAPKVRQTA